MEKYREVYEKELKECLESCARGFWFCLRYCEWSARLEAAKLLGPEEEEKILREAFVWR